MHRVCVTLAGAVLAVTLASCGSTTITTSDASTFWRQSVASHYNGVVASGDGRGCVEVGSQKWSCTAYVRNKQNSLSSGQDVIGTVTVAGSNMNVSAHTATGNEIQTWFAAHPHGAQ